MRAVLILCITLLLSAPSLAEEAKGDCSCIELLGNDLKQTDLLREYMRVTNGRISQHSKEFDDAMIALDGLSKVTQGLIREIKQLHEELEALKPAFPI